MPETQLSKRSRRDRTSSRTASAQGRRGARGPSAGRPSGKILLSVIALSCVGALAAYALYGYAQVRDDIAPPEAERAKISRALSEPPRPQRDPYTYVLLLGNDARSPGTRARSDTILIARLSSLDKSVLLLSIPRDTRVPVAGKGMTKINHASAYGGVALQIDTVRKFTGLPINHYVQIDFAGFGAAVDAIGGVDMYLDRQISTREGWIGPGVEHLDGAAALSVVRNRGYSDGDFSRVRTQQRFLTAVMKKLAIERDPARIARYVSIVSSEIETDMTMGEMLDFLRAFRSAAGANIPSYTVPGSPARVDGVSYVIPDEAGARALFESIKRGETPPADGP